MNTSRIRSLIKACTWRLVASLDTLLLVWLITGSFAMGAGVSTLEIFTKLLLYYGHERLWNNLRINHIVNKITKTLRK